jgi:CBS domain-containing protein
MIKVEDMMTRHPHTLQPTNTIEDARILMSDRDIRHIPVVDNNHKLLGIVSQRDVLRAQNSSLDRQLAPTATLLTHPISKIMHTHIVTVSPVAGLKESAIYMQKHKVGCLPVVEKETLVGIITDSDFVIIAINLLELQEDIEPEEFDTIDAFDDIDEGDI